MFEGEGVTVNFPKLKRVLYKLSGETLSGPAGVVDLSVTQEIANDLKAVSKLIELVVVCGAGNIVRGRGVSELQRPVMDCAGMISTAVNALTLRACLMESSVSAVVLGSFEGPGVEKYDAQKCQDYLANGRIVILAGGLGVPFFSTDSLAAVRAGELRCDAVIKASNVDGIFDKDPNVFEGAVHLPQITYDEVVKRGLSFMDLSASCILKERGVPCYVFNRQRHTVEAFLTAGDVSYSEVC